jgi:lipoprotein Spr
MPISSKVDNMLKNLTVILVLACLAASCSSLKHSASQKPAPSATASTTVKDNSGNSVQFISNIAIHPDVQQEKTGSSIATVSNVHSGAPSDASADAIENAPALQFKYSILENASVEELDNSKLLAFMDYWYGAPYHYGGTARDGIDCSAFAFLLISSVYGVSTLPRTSKEQYEACRHIPRDELKEGDLVFFHTLGKKKRVTHVGVYLRNNKFIHASISGVMISDMSDGYYDKRFIGAGRVL